MTKSKLVSREKGVKLEQLKMQDLGFVKRAVVGKDTALLLEGAGSKSELQERVQSLKYQLDDADLSEYERSKLRERVGKLSGGVAVIQVGGGSELEVAEAKDRIDDALCATRAAVEAGILPGGGTALLFAAEALKQMPRQPGENIDQRTGIEIIRRACMAPTKLIAANAGEEGAIVVGNILR